MLPLGGGSTFGHMGCGGRAPLSPKGNKRFARQRTVQPTGKPVQFPLTQNRSNVPVRLLLGMQTYASVCEAMQVLHHHTTHEPTWVQL